MRHSTAVKKLPSSGRLRQAAAGNANTFNQAQETLSRKDILRRVRQPPDYFGLANP